MIDPIFPDAAEVPWENERYRVGKHSPGTMKVVAFGRIKVSDTITATRTASAELSEFYC